MEQPPPLQPEPLTTSMPTRDERTWAMLAHILPLPAVSIAVGHILAPLIIWLLKREESPFIGDQAKEALNFQICMTIYGLVAGLLSFFCIGFLLAAALGVAWLILMIIATLQANAGVAYRYPLIVRLL